ncbi:MAG TPA: ABC transporter ATP-binding protein [Mycobacteriales bacterium]|nr:ABC transporter ATP-binding protein [Mycobacteriales bacterium]
MSTFSTPTAASTLRAAGLGKRYGRKWALRGCTVEIPAGRIAGLVGPNGAGKTTLLQCAVGLLTPTEGSLEVLGERPAANPEQLGRVGFLAQDAPLYASLSVADHLRFGAHTNARWDGEFARERIAQLQLDPAQPAGGLSGGQRAQVALTVALAKRPELLVLDEPVAALDPLARRDFLAILSSYVAEHGISVILSSHLLADLERVCDFLVLVSAARVQLADDVDELLATHRRISGPRRDLATLPADQQLVWESHTDRQSTAVVRTTAPILDPAWQVEELSLEDIVLAYMGGADEAVSAGRSTMGVLR